MENDNETLLNEFKNEFKKNKKFLPPFSGDESARNDKNKLSFYKLYNTTPKICDDNLDLLREKAIGIIENNILNNSTENINKLTHKIWVTSNESPSIPTEVILQSLKSHYQELSDYKHYFWTNNVDTANKIINLLNLNDINITIKNINEFNDIPCIKYVDLYLKHRLYANAGDILRIIIVYKYGGIYSDMGFSLKKYMNYILNDFDVMFNGEGAEWVKGCISPNVIYAKEPKNLIFEAMLNNLTNKEIIYKADFSLMQDLVAPKMIMVFLGSHYSNKKVVAVENNDYTFDRYHMWSHMKGYNDKCKASILSEKVQEEEFIKDFKNINDNFCK